MIILKKGLFADLLRFDELKNGSIVRNYMVQIRNKDGSRVNINCGDYTGASALTDILNYVLPDSYSDEPNAPNIRVLREGE